MASIFGSLFGSKKATQQPASALRVNTSLQGVPIALILGGLNRLGGNIIDYYGFNYVAASSSASAGGGKGGSTGGGSGKGNSGSYNYFASFVVAICEGPATVSATWQNGAIVQRPTDVSSVLGLNGFAYTAEYFPGNYTQEPFGYTEAVAPDRAFNYRGITYLAYGNFPLGSSTSLPNITVQIGSATNINAIPGQPDGDVSVAWTSWLFNPYWGVGFPSSRSGDLSQWSSYTRSLGIVVSPVVASAIVASGLCNDLTAATNAESCWQDGLLTVVPRGDTAVSLGQITTTTETHAVPGGGDPYPKIVVGNVGTFAGNVSVAYTGGATLTEVQVYEPSGLPGVGSPLVGQFYQSAGIYYFNFGDAGRSVDITYKWAASAAYTPDTRALYDFTIDDFMVNSATIGQGIATQNSPLVCVRKPRDQMLNNIQVQYLDRNNTYNPVTIEVKDEASIVAYGRERASGVKPYQFFCLASAAQQSATLHLIREQTARTFQFTCGRHFLLIMQLMGIYTVTDPGQGLFRQGVRLIEVGENPDSSLTWTCEEYTGTVSAPVYGSEAMDPFVVNDNADPGPINAPIIFEPTDELGGGLQVWAAVSGVNTDIWGGCFLHVSYDAINYSKVPKPIVGPARMGVLTAPLAVFAANPVGQTIDAIDTLSVDLTESAGALSAATELDAVSLNTRCYVGGEIVAYANAVLTAPNAYNLTYLVRGAYGTEAAINPNPSGSAVTGAGAGAANVVQLVLGAGDVASVAAFATGDLVLVANINGTVEANGTWIVDVVISGALGRLNLRGSSFTHAWTSGGIVTNLTSHRIGAPFARIDNQIFEVPYDQSRIGATVYLKFQSFNIYQGGLQNLAELTAYPFVLTGSALSSPLPNVTNLRASYDVNSGFTVLDWDEVSDFRPVRYEIRTGTSPSSASTLGTPAHPPFRVPGDGEYLVAAVSQPVAGLTVYSENWETITIAGAVITQNVILTVDLKALNWPGTFTGGAGVDVGLNAIRTGGGNILTDANVLTTPDILNYGAGSSLSGVYYPDTHAYIDLGYVANASVSIKYQPTGVPVGQDILGIGNILTTPDILGSASTQFINNYPLINFATATGGDLYAIGDLYANPDLFIATDAAWNGFQAFTPGTYQARFLYFAFFLSTIDPNTISYNLQFKITVTIPARIDTYAATTSASVDTTITFAPTGASAAAFNGGAGPGNLPAITSAIVGSGAAGDDFIITALSLSAISFKIVNAGSRVVRNLNLFAQGY